MHGGMLMKKKLIYFILFSAFMSLAGTFYLLWQEKSIPLLHIEDFCKVDDCIYMIHNNKTEIQILKLDQEGNLLERLKSQPLQNEEKETFYTYQSLCVDKNKKVYLLRTESNINNRALQEEVVFQCDFETGELVQAAKIPYEARKGEIEKKHVWKIRVDQGKVSYICLAEKEETQELVLNQLKEDGSEKEVKKITGSNQIEISEFVWDENFNITYTNQKGEVYVCGINSQKKKIYPMEEEKEFGPVIRLSMDKEGTVYFTDLEKDNILKINEDKNGCITIMEDVKDFFKQLSWKENEFTKGMSLEYSDLKQVCFQGEKEFWGLVFLEQDKQAIGSFHLDTQEEKAIFKVEVPESILIEKGINYFGTFFLIISIILLLLFVLMEVKKMRIPILIKMIGVMIPILVLGIFLFQDRIDRELTEQLINSQYIKMHREVKEKITAMNRGQIKQFSIKSAFDDSDFFDAKERYLREYDIDLFICSSAEQKKEEVYDTSYQYAYKVEEKTPFTMFCENQPVGVPLKYNYSNEVMELFQHVIDEKENVKCTFTDNEGTWFALIVPIKDNQGEVISVIEVGTAQITIDHLVKKSIQTILNIIVSVMAILLAALSAILFISLRPLKRLKREVNEIGKGRFGIEVPVRGRDEIAEISEVFNLMSNNIQRSMEEMKKLNESCYKFVPSKMFELLNKESVKEAELGAQSSRIITIMTVKIVEFRKKVHVMSADAMFQFINENLSRMIPPISEKGGVVGCFEDAGVIAFYTEGSESALVSAISICNEYHKIKGEEKNKWKVSVGIGYGPVMIGIVGNEKRLETTTVSEYTNLTLTLQEIAPKYYADILITSSVADEIPDFHNKFHAREIGFIYIRATRQAEKLYDIYDGNIEEDRRKKEQTKDLFEKGVSLYYRREFYEARLIFIEVLKMFRKDAAAKEYVYRCDKYYKMKQIKEEDIWLEIQ